MGSFNRFGGGKSFGGRDSGKRSFSSNRGGRDFGSRDSGSRPQMHPAVCDECGRDCEVPFVPTGNKKIYCSNCFRKQDGNDNRNDNGNRFDRPERSSNFSRDDRGNRDDRGDREMFPAVCDNCGKACRLPFKPSSNKPVFCSDCFSEQGEKTGVGPTGHAGSDVRAEMRELKDQLISINVKIEKIMKALDIQPVKVKISKEEFVASGLASESIANLDNVSEVAAVVEEVVEEQVKKPAKKATTKKTTTKTK